jgi:hypothetical protein
VTGFEIDSLYSAGAAVIGATILLALSGSSICVLIHEAL